MQRAEIDLAQYELDQSLIRRDNIENDVQFDLDVQKAEINRLQAEINKAESDLEDTTITSPFDGVILSVPAFEGGKVNPGEAVVEISHPNDFQLEGSIDEIDVLHITPGMNAFITIDAESSLNVPGVVEEISITPSVQQGVVSYSVTVGLESVPSVQLRDGLSAVAEIVIENSPNQIAIPLNAIRGPEDNPFVLIKTESAVENRAVRLGLSDDFWVSVVDGLGEGETILVQGKPIVGEEFNMRSLRRPRGR
jgi:HlyD family secretion protein